MGEVKLKESARGQPSTITSGENLLEDFSSESASTLSSKIIYLDLVNSSPIIKYHPGRER